MKKLDGVIRTREIVTPQLFIVLAKQRDKPLRHVKNNLVTIVG